MKWLKALLYVGVILFFLTEFFVDTVFGWSSSYFFESVVVLAAMLLVTRGTCGCCCGEKHCNVCPVDMKKEM
jgi:hypothetical protein